MNPEQSLKATPIVLSHGEGVASGDEDSVSNSLGDATHFATAQQFALPRVTQMVALRASQFQPSWASLMKTNGIENKKYKKYNL